MISLSAKIRKETGQRVKDLRAKGIMPVVLYGPKIKNLSLEVDEKQFEKVLKEAGESTLISLDVDSEKPQKFLVLVHDVAIDPLSQKPIHADFYQPKMDKEIAVTVPLVFTGEAKAVKDLGGTLVKNLHDLEVIALPQSLPHEIQVPVDKLETFDDSILIKDLILPKGVRTAKDPKEIVALVLQPEKIEEELSKPVEEKVEEVEKVEKKKEVKEVKEEAEETK